MAYWWVNQKKSYKSEYAGGFIWAPIQNDAGKTFFHWDTLEEVKEGDIIFSNVNGIIKSVGIALNDSYLAEKPIGHAPGWHSTGRRADIKYFKIQNSLNVSEIHNSTTGYWSSKYSPIVQEGDRANQGYLFSVPVDAGDRILQILNLPDALKQTTIDDEKTRNKTTKKTLIDARIGQGQFRKDLMKQWSNKCAITKLPVLSLLTASHIKPWSISNHKERLDPNNGLLLNPTYNALFDRFLISFSETGELVKSNRISWKDLELLGINTDSKLIGLTEKNKKYLRYHLEEMRNKKS